MTGIFDYKRLVDEFQAFIEDKFKNGKAVSTASKEKLLEYGEAFKANECYKFPMMRDEATRRGMKMLGIPISKPVQEEIAVKMDTDGVVKASAIIEEPAAPIIETPSVPTVTRQSDQSGQPFEELIPVVVHANGNIS